MSAQHNVVYAAWIGIDWADQQHDYCLSSGSAESVELGTVGARPEEVAVWLDQLRSRFSGHKIALCIEQSKGALIYQVMGVDFIDLYPLNPQALANFRKAFVVSGAKDDPTDAQLLWEYVRKHQNHLRLWTPQDAHTRKLARLVEDRRHLVDQRTQFSNQLTAVLKEYYPQALAWDGDTITGPMACDFLRRWPTLPQVKRCREQTLRDFYTTHQVRSQKLIDARLADIASSRPGVTDEAIVEPCVLKVQALVGQIVGLNATINTYDRLIADLFDTHADHDLFDSLPGAGPALAPRLLTALGTDRERFAKADDVATFVGIVPVTRRSGKRMVVHWRWACSKFLRQTFHEFANHSRHQSTWARAYYDCQRTRGKSHHAAVRALAFKWIRIIYHCWKCNEIYDEAIYLAALEKRQSPLIQFMAQAA